MYIDTRVNACEMQNKKEKKVSKFKKVSIN